MKKILVRNKEPELKMWKIPRLFLGITDCDENTRVRAAAPPGQAVQMASPDVGVPRRGQFKLKGWKCGNKGKLLD